MLFRAAGCSTQALSVFGCSSLASCPELGRQACGFSNMLLTHCENLNACGPWSCRLEVAFCFRKLLLRSLKDVLRASLFRDGTVLDCFSDCADIRQCCKDKTHFICKFCRGFISWSHFQGGHCATLCDQSQVSMPRTTRSTPEGRRFIRARRLGQNAQISFRVPVLDKSGKQVQAFLPNGWRQNPLTANI